MSDPDLSLGVLPNQDLEWKIDGAAGRCQHHGRTRLWISKDEKFRRAHFQSDFRRFATVIDQREQRYPLCLENRFKLFDRFVHQVVARQIN